MDGFVNVYKERGYSSHNAVAAVRRLLSCKAGHGGTLDPLAEGVLPVGVNSATRLFEYFADYEKRYIGEVTFGTETESYDAGGEVVRTADASFVTREMVEALLPQFVGDIMQRPPLISALKRGGEPLYKLARRGEDVPLPEPRPVHIESVQLLSFEVADGVPRCRIEVACGGGTYIRSIAHDLGQLLGCGAYLTRLIRTQVGPFRIEDALTPDQLQQRQEQGDSSFLLPPEFALAAIPALPVPAEALRKVRHGNPAYIEQGADHPVCRITDADGRLLGIGSCAKDKGRWLVTMRKVLVAAEPQLGEGTAVAIGNFDGVHVGHQVLLHRLSTYKNQGRKTIALTFAPHPLQLLQGEAPPMLCTDAEKEQLLCESYRADELLTLDFTEQLRDLSPQDFVQQVLKERCGAAVVVVGYDFRFGAGGAGDAEMLRRLAAEQGIAVEVVPAVKLGGRPVSSTRVRNLLEQGDVEAAAELLGRWYTLSGVVCHGNQLGRTLGFPTANFQPQQGRMLPPLGVYAAKAELDGVTYDAVVNIGRRPTVTDDPTLLVEAHLLGFAGDAYGKPITVFLGKRLRREKKFASAAELAEQITADKQSACDFLAANKAEFGENKHLPNLLV
ncbi:MAG: bifunctional riboflavin kinase/FAD synthetase [Firmicutes bacterium]|nr:bifunctional riboflavin kinase/FAD synthetase [Bacillota bacterium]MBR7113775.1 bifunctional riboflavin kinase/FAD synthetase [Bacillota bacterium]